MIPQHSGNFYSIIGILDLEVTKVLHFMLVATIRLSWLVTTFGFHWLDFILQVNTHSSLDTLLAEYRSARILVVSHYLYTLFFWFSFLFPAVQGMKPRSQHARIYSKPLRSHIFLVSVSLLVFIFWFLCFGFFVALFSWTGQNRQTGQFLVSTWKIHLNFLLSIWIREHAIKLSLAW